MSRDVSYRTVKIDGISIFCREAGSKDAPTILLHGIPSLSRMFEPLSARLADRFSLGRSRTVKNIGGAGKIPVPLISPAHSSRMSEGGGARRAPTR